MHELFVDRGGLGVRRRRLLLVSAIVALVLALRSLIEGGGLFSDLQIAWLVGSLLLVAQGRRRAVSVLWWGSVALLFAAMLWLSAASGIPEPDCGPHALPCAPIPAELDDGVITPFLLAIAIAWLTSTAAAVAGAIVTLHEQTRTHPREALPAARVSQR